MTPTPPASLPDPAAHLAPDQERFVLALLDHHGDIPRAYVKALEPDLRNREVAYQKGLKLYALPSVQAEYTRLVNITLLERTGIAYTTALRELVDIVTAPMEKVPIKDKIAAAKAIFEAIGTRQEVNVTNKAEIGENLKDLFKEIAKGEDVVPVDVELVKEKAGVIDVPPSPLEVVEQQVKDFETREGLQLMLEQLKEDYLTGEEVDDGDPTCDPEDQGGR